MKNVLLISEEKLKYFSELDPNIDYEELILPWIKVSQDTNLQETIGSKFLKGLYDGVRTNTLSQTYKDLINNYIADLLIHYTIFNALPTISMRIKQAGVVRNNTETGQGIDNSDVRMLRQQHKELGQFYTTRLLEELCDNPTKYPLYVNPGTEGMMPNKRSNGYKNGFAFPKKGRYNSDNSPSSNS
tara:strand:+ start:1136 stop:1693 length:558 start_codon:yes stop_codon:yes gene_type:complete